MNDTAQAAIAAALSGNWEEAVNLNGEILKANAEDVDALNRLARAYAELGNLSRAKLTSRKVLKIDAANMIAARSLAKWEQMKGNGEHKEVVTPKAALFLEEPGKTKIIELMHLGSPAVVAPLTSGDPVSFNSHQHRVSVINGEGKYIGRLPDSLAARVRKLIKDKVDLNVFIKSADKHSVSVFVRSSENAFPTEKLDYVSFTPPELVYDKADLEAAEV